MRLIEPFGTSKEEVSHITVLNKANQQRDITGEFLGRLVLGLEGDDQVKIFGATIY